LLAAVRTLLNKTRALEHGDMLLHGGEAHLVPRSKSGHRRRFRERPRQDVASRAIGQGTEQLVERLVALFSTYNHMVVCSYIARSIFCKAYSLDDHLASRSPVVRRPLRRVRGGGRVRNVVGPDPSEGTQDEDIANVLLSAPVAIRRARRQRD